MEVLVHPYIRYMDIYIYVYGYMYMCIYIYRDIEWNDMDIYTYIYINVYMIRLTSSKLSSCSPPAR